jgi:hypothetical protein
MRTKPRVMIFIDGTNLLRQMSKFVDLSAGRLDPHSPPPEVFGALWTFLDNIESPMHLAIRDYKTGGRSLRYFWFGSYHGHDDYRDRLREAIWTAGFREVVLVQKPPTREEKGVDTSLAVEMVVNAERDNFDTAILVSGDRDHVRAVQEVKRHGKQVTGVFFLGPTSDELRFELDGFWDLGNWGDSRDVRRHLAKCKETLRAACPEVDPSKKQAREARKGVQEKVWLLAEAVAKNGVPVEECLTELSEHLSGWFGSPLEVKQIK